MRLPLALLTLVHGSQGAALFNHACAPNAHTDFALDAEGRLVFVATRAIRRGTEATISYLSSEEPTYVRRAQLVRAKCFVCTCSLCADPTEGGRCGGFLRCARCDGWRRWRGSLSGDEDLSHAPHAPCPLRTISRTDDWVCAGCGTLTRHSDVLAWDATMRRRLEEVTHVGSEDQMRQILSELLAVCHPNHALVLQARLLLVAFGFDDASASEGDNASGGASPTHRKLAAAEEALCVARRLLPSADAQIADLLFTIGSGHHALAQQAFALGDVAGRAEGVNQLREAARAMLDASRTFTDALPSLRAEDNGSPAAIARQFATLCMQQANRELRCGAIS